MEFEDLKKELDGQFKTLTDLVQTQQNEIKEFGATREVTSKAIEKAENSIEAIQGEIKSVEDKINTVLTEQKARIDELEKKGQRPGFGVPAEMKSLGQAFVESEEFKKMLSFNEFTSAPMKVKSIYDFQEKAPLTPVLSAITGGYLQTPFRLPDINIPGQRTLRIRDLLSVTPTGTNAIEYVIETGFTNNAAPVAEGEDKPQSELKFELKTEAIKTIAHWIPIGRQVLQDVSQLRGYIDNRMTYGLKLVEENQILYGNGISQNLNGIMTQASTYDWSSGQPDDTKLDCIRRAMTVAQLAEYPVNGLVVHPTDWQDIELLKDSTKKYIWIVVTEGGIQRLFGLPVVVTTAMQSGEALIGAFNMGAMLWDREDANVRISEHHADYFIKNLIALLVEERIGLTVFRPEAFVAIDFDNAPVAS